MDESNIPQNSVDSSKGSGEHAYKNVALPASIIIAALMVSGSLFLTRSSGGPFFNSDTGAQITTPDDNVVVDIKTDSDDYVLGSADAKVTMVEFSDFQCPFCRQFFELSLSQIKTNYIDTGKVKLIYKHMPLSFHPAAMPAALAAECAGAQGMFWQMHDLMFSEQAKLGQGTVQFGVPELKKWAASLKLNATTFNQCLDAQIYAGKIKKDSDYALSLGLNGTPSFYINGHKLVGALPYEQFKAAIDAELAK